MAACGTRSGYQAGCRCEACRDANRVYIAANRTGRRRYSRMPFESTCWCEATTVAVTEADVLNGRTHSCGARGCHPKAA